MIIIAPYARIYPGDVTNPKNYPYWPELIELLKPLKMNIVQVGISGEKKLVEDFRPDLSLDELKKLILECNGWISVDSFFQHYAWSLGVKGIVIFSQSDPNIFGHHENINLLKDRKYLREKQFWLWSQTQYIKEAFVDPTVVFDAVKTQLKINENN